MEIVVPRKSTDIFSPPAAIKTLSSEFFVIGSTTDYIVISLEEPGVLNQPSIVKPEESDRLSLLPKKSM